MNKITKDRFKKYLNTSNLAKGGIALLCSAAFISITGATDSKSIMEFIGNGIGVGVFSNLLFEWLSDWSKRPTEDDQSRMTDLTKLLANQMQNNPILVKEISEFLKEYSVIEIAEELVSGDVKTYSVLLLNIYQESMIFKTQLAAIDEKLSELLTYVSYLNWADLRYSSVDSLDDYLTNSALNVEYIDFPGIPNIGGVSPKSKEVYIYQQLTYKNGISHPYSSYNHEKLLLIQDIAGSGKTTLGNRILRDIIDEHLSQHSSKKKIPFKLSAQQYKDLEPSNSTLNQLIDITVKTSNLTNSVAQHLFESGRNGELVFILDGLDENSQESDRHRIFNCLLNSSFGNNQIIITSRPFDSTGLGAFTRTSLARFDSKDAILLLYKWKQFFDNAGLITHSINEKLNYIQSNLNDIGKKYNARTEILQTPLHLTNIIFLAFLDDIKNFNVLLDNEICLIKKIVQESIPFWEEQKNGRKLGENGYPDKTTALKILYLIGFILQDSPGISESDLLFAIDRESNGFLKGHEPKTWYERSYRYWLNCNVIRKSQFSSINFWHFTIQEYCAAMFLNSNYGIDLIKNNPELKMKLKLPEWANIRRLIILIQGTRC